MNSISDRFEIVLERIARAAQTAGRKFEDVKLVTVTKTHPVSIIGEVIEAGARVLGENYADEAVSKIEHFSLMEDLEWHMIGHVQSRKSKLVAGHFQYMDSLDSVKLAQRLDRQCGEIGRVLPVLLELNTGGEETKYGWPVWDNALHGQFMNDVETLIQLPYLRIEGLMTVPPFTMNPEELRVCFKLMRQMQEMLAPRFPTTSWSELSMGMSADFEIAIQEGATLVRLGSAILGPRNPK